MWTNVDNLVKLRKFIANDLGLIVVYNLQKLNNTEEFNILDLIEN